MSEYTEGDLNGHGDRKLGKEIRIDPYKLYFQGKIQLYRQGKVIIMYYMAQ